MEYKIKAYNIWETGKKRDENGLPHQEDALFPEYGACSPADRIFVLCDGMGGHDNGEIASSVVCRALPQSLSSQLGSASGIFRDSFFVTALNAAYDALDANDTGSPKKMGTTMALLCLYEKGYFMAHIGDTRIYHIRPGDDEGSTQVIFSTRDHSLVNKLADSGKLSQAEAEASAHRHVITRAMQPNMQSRPQADVEVSSDIRPGDYFLMCTHGMLENLSDTDIKQIFSRQGGNDANKLGELRAATEGCRDNHSAIIVHIEDVFSAHSASHSVSDSATSVSVAQRSNAPASKSGKKGSKRNFSDRAVSGDIWRLISRFLVALMMLLTMIMVIYYAFIRNDEAMLEAGRSGSHPASQDYDPYRPDDEKYGYETKATEIIDDRVVDDGNADIPEETLQEETVTEERTDPEKTDPETEPEPSAPAADPVPDPAPQPDMPILQE